MPGACGGFPAGFWQRRDSMKLVDHIPGKVALAGALLSLAVTASAQAGEAKMTSAKTVQGGSLAIRADKGVTVDGARVVTTDIQSSNGVIHVIDAVLMPTP
jgi:uncharacterized surface protein with fasciclin (FAS1) repeats